MKMKRCHRDFCRLFILVLLLTFCIAPVVCYADGLWTEQADQTIYDSIGDVPDFYLPDMLEGGIFAELLGEFCIGIAQFSLNIVWL